MVGARNFGVVYYVGTIEYDTDEDTIIKRYNDTRDTELGDEKGNMAMITDGTFSLVFMNITSSSLHRY